VAPTEPSPGIPSRVGRYEVITHLATGGMAQIYLARQSGLGAFERHVVLKTILRERASDQRFITMFLDEAKLAATLNHQNIAQVYEVDQADGAYFMAMEYVHGENARAILETTIRRGWTIPLELAVMIVGGAAAGLHHAHERRGKNGQPLNIVHRDVSPANVMVGYDGSVKVLDFGIAKAEERATKTVGGTIKGKYGYMSPEQCKGKPLDRRSDIFALGICLYELTTLRRAFKGQDDFETMKRIVAGDVMPPSVAVPGYPPELEAIVRTAMATDMNGRFQTAQEMIEALDAFTVRAKLTGSNTAIGRFMVQLFGSKREPWVEGGRGGGGERTQVTANHDEVDPSDNEKTKLMEDRQAERLARLTAQPPPAPHQPPPPIASTRPGLGSASPKTPPGGEWQPSRSPPARIPDSAGYAPPQATPIPGSVSRPPGSFAEVPQAHAPAPRVQSYPPAMAQNRSWIVLVALMLTALGAGILIAMTGG
jgi:eukaryotic-like serine/threonine-protein kinase